MRRAAMAVALFAGFYATGLAIAGALLWLPWAQWRYTGGLDPSGILAVLGAAYVVWALVPPRRRWLPPGLELTASAQPRVHALIADVAGRVAHPLPAHVYLVDGMNAFASSRPRWLGLRREPILGLGLPLFAFLTEREWTAVLGHEFGHHVGGDVRLGPWQHGTHRAIAAALSRLDGSSLLLHLPFYAYGLLFLRVTGASSREQELRADALAARLAGAEGIGGALVALERHEEPWATFWHGVFRPAVAAGFLPPVLEGYRLFLDATRDERATAASEPPPPGPGDTHPPLAARLAALAWADPGRADEVPAALLDEVRPTEERLIALLIENPDAMPSLERIEWSEWGARVLPRVWEDALGQRLATLVPHALTSLPTLLEHGLSWWERLREGVNVFSPEARQRQLRDWLGQWAALTLFRGGFRVVSGPGADPVLEKDGVRVQPFRCVLELAAGRMTRDQWVALVLPF